MATPVLKAFYADRYLHVRSFAKSFALALIACVVVASLHQASFYHFSFHANHLLLIPLGVYAGGLSAVWIHNATHGSFSTPFRNWLAGHIAGIHQLWGFTGWKLIHLVHHMYSDHPELDPHPPKDFTFWEFARIMFVHSSQTISAKYREHFGDNERTQKLQLAARILLIAMASANLALWFLLLGPAGFIFFYIPSYIANHLLFVDVNYTAHPKDENGKTAAANLNHTLYYKIANFFWHGIYFHGNHHRRPLLFNPRTMQARAPKAGQPDISEAA